MNLFNQENKWFKGNLHTHTTLSDGKMNPDEAIGLYREKGYDFLAITDHRKLYKGEMLEDFLILSGVEFDHNVLSGIRKAWHIVGIDVDNETPVDEILSVDPEEISGQYFVKSILENKGFAIVAHPAWSFLTYLDVAGLRNATGFEIWNTVSDTRSNRGDSTMILDILSARGEYPLIFAVDDTHFYDDDLFGGYIMVNSPSLRREDIVENIRVGNFYCSCGPEIHQITIEDDMVDVHCSPVDHVAFMSDSFYVAHRIAGDGTKEMDHAKYKIMDTDSYVRIELVDKNGKKAWSQIIDLQKRKESIGEV